MKKIIVVLGICLVLSACTTKSNPEAKSPVDTKSVKLNINGQISEFDVVSGPTTGKKEGPKFTGADKDAKMKWSGRPSEGVLVGDYYYDSLLFDGSYLAIDSVIKDGDKILSIRFDEKAPDNYYDTTWKNQTKRTSGYANWQMANDRTSISLVTIVNAMTYLESQVIEKNSVSGEFKSPDGSSNSVNNGFVPLLKQIEPKLNQKSTQSIISVTRDLGEGIFGSMQVVYDKSSNNIVDFHYDEYFADEKDQIKDETLKEFYRQSKYQSPYYKEKESEKFSTGVDDYRRLIIGEQEVVESSQFGDGFNSIVKEINILRK
ncbi:MAG: hypothetical protein RR565_10785 [Erysipelothrix sp.]